jgi:ribosome biogenesis protein BRX1
LDDSTKEAEVSSASEKSESSGDEEEGSEKGSVVSEIDPEEELRAFKDAEPLSKEWKNRQRVLLVCQRGIEGRFRHLMEDLVGLIPHSKKEQKVEKKQAKVQINELCYERSCNNFIYFESRSHKDSDLYMWASKSPNGPSFKFSVQNIHTLDELKLSGNCLKYSRPMLSFDGSFDDKTRPHLQLAKEVLSHIFNTPKNHPKSKPFIDHVISFNLFDDRIWLRNYQILNQHEEQFTAEDDIEKLVLIEIGPRMCMNPIKAFEGPIGGEALWQNEKYIAPAKLRGKRYDSFVKKRDHKEKQKEYKKDVMKNGKDPDSYLQDAFGSQESGDEQSEDDSDI